MASAMSRYSSGTSLASLYSRAVGRAPGRGFDGGLDRIKAHLTSGGEAVRQAGESAVIGGALSFAHVHLKTGLDVGTKKIPVDLAGGVLSLLAGIALPPNEGGIDLRNAGASMLTVFTFRKGVDYFAKKKGGSNGAPIGANVAGDFGAEENDMGADPIIQAAMAL